MEKTAQNARIFDVDYLFWHSGNYLL